MLVICGKHTEAHTVISKIHQHIDGLSGHDSDRNILFFSKGKERKTGSLYRCFGLPTSVNI